MELMSGFEKNVRQQNCLIESNILNHNLPHQADALPVKKRKQFEWEIIDSPPRLKRTYSFKNQEHLLEFIGAVIEYQNISHHHGKIIIDVNDVTIIINTHDLNDVTERDFEYARTLSQMYDDSLNLF
jgi:pterin-4a-carbinolamine dehydratase